jgi:geranylgeranyl diphosphate synthase type I
MTNGDIKAKLGEFRGLLEGEMRKYLDQKAEEAAQVSLICGTLVNHVADMTMRGGKRVRAAILYYSYIAHGGQDLATAMKAAIAFELVQAYLLIHDDIIDNDDFRRGGITIHKAYELIAQESYKKVDSRHYGQAVGILAGDVACGYSNEIIAELDIDPILAKRAIVELNKMYMLEYFGQLLDIHSEVRDDIKPEDVILIHKLKTSPYTFDGPLKIGAILAGASTEEIKLLEGYSIPLGVAFQIQDDILGTFGSEEKLGKPVTSDLSEGKKTLLVLDALASANEQEKAIIEDVLGNQSISDEAHERVKQVMMSTGALDKSKALAQNYAREAVEAIKGFELNEEGKAFMIDIAEYMVNRES